MSDLRLEVRVWKARAYFARRVVFWIALAFVAENLALGVYFLVRSFEG